MFHIHITTLINFFTVASLTFVLSGCTDGGSLRTSSSIIGEGWAAPPEPYDPPALYCYSTLGAPDCHAVPLANAQTRVKGSYAGPQALPLENKDDQNIDVETVAVSDPMESTMVYQNHTTACQTPIATHFKERSVTKTHIHSHPQQTINLHHHNSRKHKTVVKQPLLPVQRQ